jgi:hypothetical protein
MTEPWIASNDPRVDRAWTRRTGEHDVDLESRASVEALAGMAGTGLMVEGDVR